MKGPLLSSVAFTVNDFCKLNFLVRYLNMNITLVKRCIIIIMKKLKKKSKKTRRTRSIEAY
eukprot:UN25567